MSNELLEELEKRVVELIKEQKIDPKLKPYDKHIRDLRRCIRTLTIWL